MKRLRLSFAFALVLLPFLRDAAAHEDASGYHFESAGTFDDGRSDIPYHWDVQTDDDPLGWGGYGTARIEYGTNDAYWAACFDLYVEGIGFADSTYTVDFGDRGITTSAASADDLSIVRKVWVPDDGMDFVRYIDTFTNDSLSDQTFTIEYRCTLGTILAIDSPTNFTSDADATFEITDTWIGADLDSDTQPAVAFVLGSDSADVRVDRFPVGGRGGVDDRVYFAYEVPIAAGETKALMVFGVQGQDEASASSTAASIADLPDDVLVWADSDIDFIQNWQFAPPGAPVVHTNGPYSVDEGDTVRLGATVEDLEGDPVSYAWDLDDDGAFDDSFALDPEVSAVGLDGPQNVSVALWASDGNFEVIRRTTVRVENVAPTITSDPGESATTGALYSYQVTATDPAGALDTLDYSVVGPPGMVVNNAGRVTWTPDESEAHQSVWDVSLVVDDGDGGEDTQEWTIDLGGAPHVVAADDYRVDEGETVRIAIVVSDSEGDPLTIGWDLDRDGDFSDAEGPEADFSAEGRDGPDDSFARVLVSDGTWDVVERVDVQIDNAPPIFDSEPDRHPRAGSVWTYTVSAHDPGGDEVTILEPEDPEQDLPPGMTYDPKTFTYTWGVSEQQIADNPWRFEVRAEDDDFDGATQEISLEIVANAPPTLPRPIYPNIDSPALILQPTLKAGNATDLDDDPLTYFFEIDRDAGFRSIDLISSGQLPENPGGVTEWMVPRSLVPGATYYWRVWANDGIQDGEKIVTIFDVVVDQPDPPTSGHESGDETAGCACRTASRSGPAPWLFGLAALVLTRRRRSRS